MTRGAFYDETYRPQFHFTARQGWLNDPNGLVFYWDEYHLFFQHNPTDVNWGNMTWGHAISRDLVHWRQQPNALEPDALGTIFSGSAVVDHDNTTGFQSGREKPLVAIYTAAGDTSPESKGQPFTQCLAYSLDRGRTWTKYAHNPVLPHIIGGNRDPKVVWHAPTRRWIMALYLDGAEFGLFASPDLKTWTLLHHLTMPDCGECPDFFEMPLKGRDGESRWVFTAANGRYLVGAFDGVHFTPETGPLQVDYGANFYAVQTYSDLPASDARRIQVAWMSGGSYPQMPFNQQMSFPCELILRDTSEGPRLFRRPVREIKTLYAPAFRLQNRTLTAGEHPLSELSGALWDIEAEFELRDADSFGVRVGDEEVRYHVRDGALTCLGRTAPLMPEDNRISLRILADRTSIEVFGNDGRVSLTSCFLPKREANEVSLFVSDGTVRLVSLTAHPLHSAWNTTAKSDIRLDWKDNRLTVLAPRLPGGKVEIWYLEAFCRKGSTRRKWEETVIPQQTVRTDGSGPTRRLRLKTTLEGGVEVEHDLRVVPEGVRFDLRLTNTGDRAVDVEWAQPCLQLAAFSGRTQETYLEKCFIFTDRAENEGLTRLSELPRNEEALYRGGQVYVPAGIDREDVNPRPLSDIVPINGLAGGFSADENTILAMAWDRTQELFQGVITCMHADFHIGGLQPGETKRRYGKLYLLDNDIPRLLRLYRKDFPRWKEDAAAH